MECNNSNEVHSKVKRIMKLTIIWQGDGIRGCMKSVRTLQCKICMTERKEILSRFRTDRSKVMNENSDIYSSCKCGGRFHKFVRSITTTLTTRMTQKKSKSSRKKSKKKSRRSFPKTSRQSSPQSECSLCYSSGMETLCTQCNPTQLFDNKVPGLSYRTLSANPARLEVAQYDQYWAYLAMDC